MGYSGFSGQLVLSGKPVPVSSRAEVFVRMDALAICATDLQIIQNGTLAQTHCCGNLTKTVIFAQILEISTKLAVNREATINEARLANGVA